MAQNSVQNASMASLAAELRNILEDCIDRNTQYESVARAIKDSIYVLANGSFHASIITTTMRPSIYHSVGFDLAPVDLAKVYNYGSVMKKNPLYYNKEDGIPPIYLREIPGFAKHDAGGFLKEAADKFMAKHPDCRVTIID